MLRSLERCLPPAAKKCIPEPAKPPAVSVRGSSSGSAPGTVRTPPVLPGLKTLRMCSLLLLCVAAGCGTVGFLKFEETAVIGASSIISSIACLLALHGAWLATLLSRSGLLKPKVTLATGSLAV